ncbi:MAG: PEP/pyruvate-binding domain-containing protein [bacterium]
MLNWIAPLSELSLADIDRVGAKAAHLGAMMRAGFNVPAGFAIDVEAFISHFGEVTDPLVKPAPPRLQAELMNNVMQALLTYLPDAGELAVRSSATDEDGQHASFAGQHSTYYFVTPNRIDQAILDCWMSLWSPAALAYRREGWVEVRSGATPRMAVIVQEMLPATRSGVVFSTDPVRPKSTDCVIEATWGLGAALVDGRVTPDHVRINEDEGLYSYHISDKRMQVQVSADNHAASRLQEVAPDKRNIAVLSTFEANQIANTAAQLETLFDAPQDVEWAYVDDQLFWLQSRPITQLAREHPFSDPLVLFKPLAENFTEPLTPLTEDLLAQVLPRVGAFYEGRFYLHLEALQKINIFQLSEAELVQAALLRGLPENLKISWSRLLQILPLFSLAFVFDGAHWLRTQRASYAALARYADFVETVRTNPKLSLHQTARQLIWGRWPFAPIGHRIFYANVSAGRYFIYIGLLKAFIRRCAPDYPQAQLSTTFHGRSDMQSMLLLQQTDYLSGLLYQAIAEDDKLATQVAQIIAGNASDMPSDSVFAQAFEEFLQYFGHRGPKELELASPRWRESPTQLLKLLYNNPPREDRVDQIHGRHLAARDTLNQHLKPWQRRVARYLTEKIGHYMTLRENTRHYHIMGFDALRQKILQLEHQLLREDKLRVCGDVFFLTEAEITDLQQDQLSPADAQLLVRKRRRHWQRQAKQSAPQTLNIARPPHPAGDDLEGYLQGQCASPGEVQGIARVVNSLSEAHTLSEGEILIAPYTDPAWTPLFPRAAGVVVATGSFLSHAGTIARELQLPCLVDVADCTRLIQTGQRLHLNATEGTITLL